MIDSGGNFLHYLLILINSHIPHIKSFDFNTLKKLHEKGTNRRTDIVTTRPKQPKGRFDEKRFSFGHCPKVALTFPPPPHSLFILDIVR